MIQSHCNITTSPFKEGLYEQHHACLESVWTLIETEASSTHHHLNHHHLDLQYRNTESIIISIFNIEIRNHHHLHLQYVNTEISSISSVWEYWNHHHLYLQYGNTEIIIISIFSIEILNHHHLHLILYVEIPDFYVLQWNTRFSIITALFIT